MKKIVIVFLCLISFTLGACTPQDKISYTRDTTPGEYIEISFAQLQEKVNNKGNLVVIFTQTKCPHCQEYKDKTLTPYMETHHLDVYNVNITNEEVPKEAFTDIQNYVSKLTEKDEQQFLGTPYMMVIYEGELVEGLSGGILEDNLESLVIEYKLDEKVE